MKNGPRPLGKRRELLSAITLGAVLLLAPSPSRDLHSYGQGVGRQDDVVLENRRDFNPPVEITSVKSQVGPISPGVRFAAGDDWLKGLTITVRNDSGEPITHISLNLSFPRPPEQKHEPGFSEPLEYGVSPVPFPDGTFPNTSSEPIMPGESAELLLKDADYDGLRATLRELNFPPRIKKVKMHFVLLGFGDGTIWSAGKRYAFDRSRPGELIPLQKKNNSGS